MNIKSSLLSCFILFSIHQAKAQSGCTDPAATNYDPSAVVNDGSCIYPFTHNTPSLRGVLSPIITETSGLVWTDGKLWTHNDSGDPPDIYSIDTSDGHTLQTVIIDNYPNVDWEDITADSGYIYVGDHGNNHGTRTDLKILKIAKSDINSDTVVHVNAEAISFSYTDQTSFAPSNTHNFDCEALISIKDSLYIFTKDRGDLQTRVYKMPKIPGSYALSPYTGFNVDGLITGADYDPASREIVLIGYMGGHSNSFLWYLNDFNGDLFFSGNKRRIEIGSGKEWQTEAVAYLSGGRIFISCETTDSIRASLFIDNKQFDTGMVSVKNVSEEIPTVYPNPSTDYLYYTNAFASGNFEVVSVSGKLVFRGKLAVGDNIINIKMLAPGAYILNTQEQGEGDRAITFIKQ